MRSHCVNVLDLEHDNGLIIEVGWTEVDLQKRKILKSYSYPVSPNQLVQEISPDVVDLTAWTLTKLRKQGEPLFNIYERLLEDRGLVGRLLVVDSPNEWMLMVDNLKKQYGSTCFPYGAPARPEDTLCVSSLWKIKHKEFGANTSLPDMLKAEGLEFEGRRHSAKDDSYNIARLFLRLTE
jgi:hypothetical protein